MSSTSSLNNSGKQLVSHNNSHNSHNKLSSYYTGDSTNDLEMTENEAGGEKTPQPQQQQPQPHQAPQFHPVSKPTTTGAAAQQQKHHVVDVNGETSTTMTFDPDNSGGEAGEHMGGGSSRKKTFVQSWIHPFNITILLCSLLLILIGLATGLIAFFTLRARDLRQAKKNLRSYSSTQADYLQKELDKSVLVAVNMKGMFEVMGSNVRLEHFQKFVNTTEVRQKNSGINTIAYVAQVQESQIPAFEAEIRANYGPLYENYTVFDLNQAFERVPLPSMPYHTPLVFSDPMIDLIVGYDIGASVSFKFEALEKARHTLQPVATSKTYFTVPGQGEEPVCEMYVPVMEDNGQIQGFSGVAFFIGKMVDAAFSEMVLKQVKVYLLDDDVHDAASDAQYLYSTTGEKNPDAGRRAISRAQFTSSHNVYMADRKWRAVFAPTSAFLTSNEGYEKWIGLFVPIVACVILSFVLALFIKGFEYSANMRAMEKDRVHILESAQQKLQKLLNSIATQEKKTRTIIDTLTDAVIVTDEHGRLLQANNSFEKMFGINETVLHNHSIENIFVNAQNQVLLTDNPLGTDLQAKNQFGKQFPVQVFSQSLVKQENGEEAFVISVRNMSDREQMLRDLENQKDRIKNLEDQAEFDSEFAVESFRNELLDFCRREVNAENVEFLVELLEYKSLPFNLRSERKVHIFNKYLKIGAQNQLNISKDVSDRIEHKIKKTKTADADLFEMVEELVKAMIIQDIFPRFKKYLESKRRTSSELSSSENTSASQDKASASSESSGHRSTLPSPASPSKNNMIQYL